VLLNGLRDIDTRAPGKEAGIVANLARLRKTYPAIDLDGPPLGPDPLPRESAVVCLLTALRLQTSDK
jgi:hypothetical protein